MKHQKLKEILWKIREKRQWRYLLIPFIAFMGILVYAKKYTRRGNIENINVNSIILVHLGAIGDALLCTPTLRALRNKYPNAKLTVYAGQSGAALVFGRNQYVSHAHVLRQVSGSEIKLIFSRKHSAHSAFIRLLLHYPDLCLRVMIKGYDLGIAFGPFHEAGTFANTLFHFTGILQQTGFFGDLTDCLSDKMDNNTLSKHWVDIYKEIAGISSENDLGSDNMEFSVTGSENARVVELLHSRIADSNKKIVVIHPGGNTFVNSKRWDYKHYAKIGDWLIEEYGYCVIITGSSDELSLAHSVVREMKQPVWNVAGRLSLGELAVLLQNAMMCITNDTSVLHLADIVEIPIVVSIFGPTNWKRIAPRNDRQLVISSTLDCSPCIDLDAGDPSKRCWRDIKEECLHTITAESVKNKLRERLILRYELG